MALKLSIGQYWPGTSLLHRLDPRAKVACAILMMVSVFFIRSLAQLGFAWACALALVLVSRVPLRKVLSSIKPIVFMLTLLSVCNLLLVKTGDVLVQFGPLVITTGSAWAALLYPLRLVVAVIVAALLLLTTTPTELTDAFDAGLAPLARFGLPAHELAMVFSLMLRFIPTIADETQAILDAQTSRGGALAEGSPLRRVKAVVPVVVALLASSTRHANNLSRALDVRCYVGGAARSHWHPLHMERRDWVALAMTAAYVGCLLALSLVG